MLEDNKIEKDEVARLKVIFSELKQEFSDVKNAFRILIGKELPV